MNRIVQVDFFRGIFLIVIATNHFLSKENIIHFFTYEFIGWITAAEGFVFLSGLTAGIVYARKLVEKGPDFIALAAKNRAWTIYKYHIILFILITLILFAHSFMQEFWYYDAREYQQLYQNPVLSMLLGSILLYQPIYLDILPMYAVFMLLLPFALKQFLKGHHRNIIIGSFLIYLLGTFNLFSGLYQFQFMKHVDTGFFNLLSWQFIFMGGLYLGFLTNQNKVDHLLQNQKLLSVAIVTCIFLFVLKKVHYRLDALPLDFNYLASKENLGPLRLLNFTALAVVMSYLAARYKQWFSFKPVSYLGKYSLEVFSLHIVLVVLLKPLQAFVNNYQAIKLTNSLYFYPGATFMLLFILIPALFGAPVIKNYFNNQQLKVKSVI